MEKIVDRNRFELLQDEDKFSGLQIVTLLISLLKVSRKCPHRLSTFYIMTLSLLPLRGLA